MNIKKITSALLAGLTVFCCSACGSSSSSSPSSSSNPTKAEAEATTAEPTTAAEAPTDAGPVVDENGYTHYPTPEDVTDLSGVDFSSPDITISYGDYDRMNEVSSQIQSYLLEGVVIDIDGVINSGMSHSIQMPDADNSKFIGTVMEVIGLDEKDYPEDKTRVHITGIVRPMNEYAHMIYVPKDHFQIVE